MEGPSIRYSKTRKFHLMPFWNSIQLIIGHPQESRLNFAMQF